jgi:hypothetical protein
MLAWWHRGGEMPSVEERVAYLEGRTDEHGATLREISDDIRGFREDVNVRLAGIDQRFIGVDHRFDALDTKFTWLIGLQVTMLVSVLGTTLGFYFR